MSRYLNRILSVLLVIALLFDGMVTQSVAMPGTPSRCYSLVIPIIQTQALELPIAQMLSTFSPGAKIRSSPEITALTPEIEMALRIMKIRQIAGLFVWLPGLNKELDDPLIKATVVKEDETPLDETAVAVWIRKARPVSLEDMAQFVVHLETWIRLHNSQSELILNAQYSELAGHDIALYFTNPSPVPLLELGQLIEAETKTPGLAAVIQPALEFMAANYATDFNARFFGHTEVPLAASPKPFHWIPTLQNIVTFRWRQVSWLTLTYHVLHSDIGRLWFAPGLWILIGSLGGFTSAMLCTFLAKFVLRPAYEGFLNSLRNASQKGGAPLSYRDFAYGFSSVHPEMTLSELRKATSELFSLSLGQEGSNRLLRVYLMERLLQRTMGFEQLKHVLPCLHEALIPPGRTSLLNAWDAIVPILETNYSSLWNEEALYILNMLHLPLQRPSAPMLEVSELWRQGKKYESVSMIWARSGELAERAARGLGRILVAAILGSARGFSRVWNLYQMDTALFWVQNRCAIALGAIPQLPREEMVQERGESHRLPWLTSSADDTLCASLLNDLRALRIPGLEPLIVMLETNVHFLFRSYIDGQWYPQILRWNRDDIPKNSRVSGFDLENNTIILSRRMPSFINMINLLRFAALTFRHQVIHGRDLNFHIADPVLVRLQQKALIQIGRSLVHQNGRFIEQDHQDRWLNVMHFMQVLPHAWSGKVYSSLLRSGVLFMRRVPFMLSPVISVREGFILSAYYFFGRRLIAVTDQPVYPEADTGFKHMELGMKLWQLLRPFWPVLTQLVATLLASGFVLVIFNDFAFDLDLNFVWNTVLEFKEWLISLDWFHIGPVMKAIWQAMHSSFMFMKELLEYLLAGLHIHWPQWQSWLMAFKETCAPLYNEFKDVVLPLFYSLGMPALIFIVGIGGGYALYRSDLRRKADQWGRRSADFILIEGLTFFMNVLALPFSYFMETTVLQNYHQRILAKLENSHFKISFERTMGILFLIGYRSAELLSLVPCFLVLITLSTRDNLILELIRMSQSQGTPVNVLMFLPVFAVLFAFPYAYFFRIMEWVLRGLKQRSWERYNSIVMGGLALMLMIGAIAFPAFSKYIFCKDPFAFSTSAIGLINSKTIQNHKSFFITDRLSADQNIAKAGWKLPPRPVTMPAPWDFSHAEERFSKRRSYWDAQDQFRHRRYRGMEDVIDPVTGWPLIPMLEGEGRARQLHDWLLLHKVPLLKALEDHSPAIYGNSAFFEHLFSYVHDDDESLLLNAFTPAEWRQILSHLTHILAWPVPARFYEEDYVRKSLALFALDSFIWGDQSITVNGVKSRRPMNVIDESSSEPSLHTVAAYLEGCTITVITSRDNKEGRMPLQVLRQTSEQRLLMREVMVLLSQVKSPDNDIALHIRNRVQIYTQMDLPNRLLQMTESDVLAARQTAPDPSATHTPDNGPPIPPSPPLVPTPESQKPSEHQPHFWRRFIEKYRHKRLFHKSLNQSPAGSIFAAS